MLKELLALSFGHAIDESEKLSLGRGLFGFLFVSLQVFVPMNNPKRVAVISKYYSKNNANRPGLATVVACKQGKRVLRCHRSEKMSISMMALYMMAISWLRCRVNAIRMHRVDG